MIMKVWLRIMIRDSLPPVPGFTRQETHPSPPFPAVKFPVQYEFGVLVGAGGSWFVCHINQQRSDTKQSGHRPVVSLPSNSTFTTILNTRVMRRTALAVTVACALVAWSNPFGWRRRASQRKPRSRHRKRVSFCDSNTIVHHLVDERDLTSAERRALSWTPAELREFARSRLIEEWIRGWET